MLTRRFSDDHERIRTCQSNTQAPFFISSPWIAPSFIIWAGCGLEVNHRLVIWDVRFDSGRDPVIAWSGRGVQAR